MRHTAIRWSVITGVMISVVIFGSVARAEIPEEGSTIHIVPLESPPLRVPGAVYGAWFGIVGIALDAPRATNEAARSSQEITEILNQSAAWQPTMILAESVGSVLDQAGEYPLSLSKQTAPIPGLSRTEYTFFGENWLKPIRRWGKEKTSSVDYSKIDSFGSDYVLEVAISNYELTGSRFLLAVNIKIVDLASREVLAASRKWKQFRTVSFEELFENNAEAFRKLYLESSKILIEKALADLGLT